MKNKQIDHVSNIVTKLTTSFSKYRKPENVPEFEFARL